MAGETIIYIVSTCRRCAGSGAVPAMAGGNPNGTCDRCNGSGTKLLDYVDLTNLNDKLDDILDKLNDINELLTTA